MDIWWREFFLKCLKEHLQLLVGVKPANKSLVLAHLCFKQQFCQDAITVDRLFMQSHQDIECGVDPLLQPNNVLSEHLVVLPILG
jgi:hypothetical protein